MNMKTHILTALREQLVRWDDLLASLNDEQRTAAQFDDTWAVKDVISHLWAWQQISIARLEAAVHNREPAYPTWVAELPVDWEANADQTNAWVYATYHGRPWSEVYGNWYGGYLRLLHFGEHIAENELLDGNKYVWLHGHSLAAIVLASYGHHQEHLEKLLDWLQQSNARERAE